MEIISLILHGCKLARDFESNIPNIANQPSILLKSCDDIIEVFGAAKERLCNLDHQSGHQLYSQILSVSDPHDHIDASLQEWLLRSTATSSQPMDNNPMQSSFDHVRGFEEGNKEDIQVEIGGRHVHSIDSYGSEKVSSSQKPRRRKDGMELRAVRVAAPTVGNTELPPDDGFTWRKYGQKEILGSRFPRSYYRCTHQKLYQCPAKKQFQRSNDDPQVFEVTYRGEHTCHKSSTAPSSSIPPPALMDHLTQHVTQSMSSTQIFPTLSSSSSLPNFGRWLSISGSGNGAGAGPSTIRYGREGAEFLVADIADAMFNSGSCSSNSMDLIFPSMDDKWEPDHDKKN